MRKYDPSAGRVRRERRPSSGSWAPRGNAEELAKRLAKIVAAGTKKPGPHTNRKLWAPDDILRRTKATAEQNSRSRRGPQTALAVLQDEWKREHTVNTRISLGRSAKREWLAPAKK
ncbi:MAG TPA: hypothetical protein VJH23_00115 [archaeon]|nr:hypothetical protein [archaeon]